LTDKDLALTTSDTQKETLRFYREGLDLETISVRRGLKSSTIAAHLEELHGLGADVDLLRFVAKEKVPLIMAQLEKLGGLGLSELKEALPDEVSYEDIRLVRGVWNGELKR
jgi:ATP-dependent DNA helicase RecQ